MKEYVVVHARRIDVDGAYDDILLVCKDKPKWMVGRFNCIGGKVEPGEDAIAAAVRELKEETGLKPLKNQPKLYCGSISGVNSLIHCVRLDVDPYDSRELSPREEETEHFEWFTFKEAWENPMLMPNLCIIVPMMHLGVTNWKIIDQSSSSEYHEVKVVLPICSAFSNGE